MKHRQLKPDYDVLIVGGGPAGLGVANVLRELGVEQYLVLERGEIGESFARWPREMRFITPSFPAHGFGQLDLNAFVPRSSPGLTLKTEHMAGRDYATYLRAIADHFQVNVRTRTGVHGISRVGRHFTVQLDDGGAVTARFVVWAAGEFQYPRLPGFPGADLCVHNSTVVSWDDVPTRRPVVIGGYESGIDSAVHLARRCDSVRVVDPHRAWESGDHDPSVSLSPFTQDRLRVVRREFGIELFGDAIVAVARTSDGYVATGASGQHFETDGPPILATGFASSLDVVRNLFSFNEDAHAQLSEHDESVAAPGLFLSGPMVHHGRQHFCFIYKFRQRFAVIGCEIGRRLGLETDAVERQFRAAGLFLDDLACCVNECQC